MDALTQQLMQQLSEDGLSQISRQIGADQKATGSALSTTIPVLVSAMAQNASKPSGAKALHQALAKDHDGAVLDGLSGFLKNPQTADGAAILGHVLGSQQPAVTQGLSQGTGLDSRQIEQLMQIIAPLVMGALGQQQQQQSFTPDSLAGFLGTQQQQAQQDNPDILSILNVLLDTNKSGSALDEIIGWLSKLFGGK